MVTGTRPAARDRRAHDVPEEPRLQGDGRAPALARDLAHRAAEVQVEVVDAVLAHQQAHRLPDVVGVDAVELQAARRSPPRRSWR